ncbi:phosphate ABC transporter ATP-binding protein PstB [Entomospira culicis]|uniref:Phosphate ABC transporter ATP-binding protein n=1 Tax=Entomospira culicis TaxID=2719989 RepID=A0A968GEX8_9SPIO|nr:phosphate ABC transporter ATP-binding protein PstB [Entomospira culicis]NIZ19142.1 phosphate ABC transporter ATP-binding protein [Entomospira culicis]NIZ69356.1 phosphate ABC transporter ATP-binding protein [Entomospira culicis]WDI37941.1 phosphate ABC transporter ATP-binding protein PstB [Entomospira culicis]WDI39569.1 phosphate ABC transporter ATP-binding protein PstB [Entomospira culicis]
MPDIISTDFNLFYGDFQALKGINMTLKEKQLTAFIGPSGCGKSTFLRSINRMNDLIENVRVTGTLELGDLNILETTKLSLLRKRVGMVFQKPNPFATSIYNNVAYGPRTHGTKQRSILDDIVEQSLKSAALWDELKDNLHKSALSLSGGQQQRLCIARSLAVDPEVLLLDEPTSALDPVSTAKIEELLEDIKSKHTIVMVTHNMQQAARISDRVAFFLSGELIEMGDTYQIFSQPQKEKTSDYITGRFG